jgi:hypothetical protein
MFRNRISEGEVAVRLLTVTRTCLLEQVSVLAYLTAAIRRDHRRLTLAVASPLPKRLTR